MRSRIVGEVNIVGDKSISHRAIILSSLAFGKSILSNVLISGDTKATINIFKNLGVEINEISNNQDLFNSALNGMVKSIKMSIKKSKNAKLGTSKKYYNELKHFFLL